MFQEVSSQIHVIFNNKAIRSVLTRLRYLIFLAAFVMFLPHIRPAWFWPGFAVSMFGELTQVWCFASLEKNRVLADSGLYRLTRNPMYLGRFFVLLGFLLLTGSIWIILGFAVLYYFYMVNRVKREEKKLRVVFGEEYQGYCRDINRFIPSFRGIDWRSLWIFKWDVFLENNGHWNFTGVFACYAIFYFFVFLYPKI
jgi:protein-S-isoprenylcysteine O-methyltransferase Ste14